MTTALLAALCAAGVALLSGGLYRLRHRSVTTRRVAELVAVAPLVAPLTSEPAAPVRSRWLLEARRVAVQFQARDTLLRTPLIAAGCLCALVGLATVSPGWMLLAVLAAIGVYFLGGSQRRQQRIEAQALDAVTLLASGLRAGYSVPQTIALVARSSPEPTASEFALATREIALGVDLADAMARLSARTASPDYELVAIIIRVQHEVGGNLAQILDSVGKTLRERLELRRQVHALTAQQRLSSIILTFLPFALLVFLFLVDRSFVEPLLVDPIGRLLLALAAIMVFLGWAVMRSVGRVEV